MFMPKYKIDKSLVLTITAVCAWWVANGLDVLSMLFVLEYGGGPGILRYHPAEFFMIYAGLRLLGTLAVWLAVVSVSRRWPVSANAAWSGMTACALVTAIAAWWRLYQ